MEHQKRAQKKVKFCIFCLIASSTTILLIPFVDFEGNILQRATGYVCGAIFWVGLLAGDVTWIVWNHRLAKKGIFRNENHFPGAMWKFFSSREAKINDTIFLLTLLWNLLAWPFGWNPGMYHSILAGILAMTFHLHYILNGRLYPYVMQKERRRERVKGEKNNES